MALQFTNLRVDYRKTESPEPWPDVPYMVINCVFKCSRSNDPGEDFAWCQAKGDSEEYKQVLTIDDPERYNAWINDDLGWSFSSKYDGYGRAWTHADPTWQYIEKFDCFWFREWVADCSVTRAIVAELEYYKENGKLPTVYRAVDECIILSHLCSLHTYWD
jgi:hypothetical protein